jgi:GNAT superfamily N-acetyltransferase
VSAHFVEIDIGSAGALRRLYHDIYVPEFPNPDERESLANMQRYLELKASGWYGSSNYHILAMFDGDNPIGLSIGDYLAAANAGVIEFLLVTPGARGLGRGRALLDQTEELFLADAGRSGKEEPVIVAEMNDPFAVNSLDDNFDPFKRALLWNKWAYGRLDFPYIQPALSSDQKPVANLLLIAKQLKHRPSIPAQRLKLVLSEYMQLAMRIEHPETVPEFKAMADYLDGKDMIMIAPLDRYVGRDARQPLLVSEIDSGDAADLDQALKIYERSFPRGATELDPAEFRSLLSNCIQPLPFRYHLWGLRSTATGPVEGMASFFCFKESAFGGYVTLTGSLRGAGYFPLLLAQMEEQIRRDAATASGWFIECAPAKESFFSQFGFHTVDFAYRQPPLAGEAPYTVQNSPSLVLMYKQLGARHRNPALPKREFVRALDEIFRAVYGIRIPENSPFLQDMIGQAEHWPGKQTMFR